MSKLSALSIYSLELGLNHVAALFLPVTVVEYVELRAPLRSSASKPRTNVTTLMSRSNIAFWSILVNFDIDPFTYAQLQFISLKDTPATSSH
jgi:hypothetical protein